MSATPLFNVKIIDTNKHLLVAIDLADSIPNAKVGFSQTQISVLMLTTVLGHWMRS